MAMHHTVNVVRLNLWTHPAFDETLAADPRVHLDVIDIRAPLEDGLALLSKAHVYHVSAARDEVPEQWQVTEALLQRCPQLVCVSSTGAGYDTIDIDACNRAGVLAVNQAGGNASSVAEMAIGLMLAVSRRIVESTLRLRTETGLTREDLTGQELDGKTLGIVGLGNIGARTAQIAAAMGMRVLAYDPYLDAATCLARGARQVELANLLAESHFVSLHCPRNKETLGLFSRVAFAQMRPGAVFVTTARGGIHNEAALAWALESGHLSGAGLDVWDTEPPPHDNPLLALPNVVATYHTAGVTHEARRKMATIAAQQVLQLARGDIPPRVVNKAALQAYAQRWQSPSPS